MSDRHEARLLLAILREDWDSAASLVQERPVGSGEFVELAGSCDVAPWVHALLERSGRLDLAGSEIRERLTRMRSKYRVDNLVLLGQVERALDVLAAARIVPVALKGLDFLHRLYGRFDERGLDDVDLLVAPSELPAALRALEAAGFRGPVEPERTHWLRSSYEMPLVSPGPVDVLFELHWGLAQEKRYSITMAPVLARAVPLEIAGRRILRLDDHDAVAHLLLHHVQHYFDRRLKWMIDLCRIVERPGFDWSVLARRLEEWGGRGAVGLCLIHIDRLFPGRLPAEARRTLPAAAWRLALTWPLRSTHPLDLFRGTRRRTVQLYLAATSLDRPGDLPGYLLHRHVRDRFPGVTERGAPQRP